MKLPHEALLVLDSGMSGEVTGVLLVSGGKAVHDGLTAKVKLVLGLIAPDDVAYVQGAGVGCVFAAYVGPYATFKLAILLV